MSHEPNKIRLRLTIPTDEHANDDVMSMSMSADDGPDGAADAYGPIGNVTADTATCLVPPALNNHEGAVEVQLALEGQHFVRPDNQGRNRVRPKIW